jgi:flagellar motor switch/type III secretory pathway protein FliN
MNDMEAGVATIDGRRDDMVRDACVRLVVSFPALTLSVREAEALRNGVIVDLGVRLAQAAMSLQLENEVIGEGRLVLVGPHAGVHMRRAPE